MGTTSPPPEPFQEIELPDGGSPVERGIVRRVRRTEDGTMYVDVVVDGLGDDLKRRILQQIRGAALTMPNADHVRLHAAPHADKDVEIPEAKHVIAVASAKGGVGKTTVSVALARTLAARGHDVGLFDADIYGPNVPHLFEDLDGPVLTNDVGQPVPLESDGIQILSPGIVAGEAPTARRGAIAYGAMENLLGQGAWSNRDVMVIDMPAGSDDVAGALLEHVPVDGAVFVTTPFDASVDDTRRTLDLYENNGVSPIAAVENMSTFECECCGHENSLFDDEVDLDLDPIHHVPFERGLQQSPGKDGGPNALYDLAESVERFTEGVFRGVPDDAVDLRGFPVECQITQLSSDLSLAAPAETIRAVIDSPDRTIDELKADAGDFVDRIEIQQSGTTGALLEIERAQE